MPLLLINWLESRGPHSSHLGFSLPKRLKELTRLSIYFKKIQLQLQEQADGRDANGKEGHHFLHLSKSLPTPRLAKPSFWGVL